MTDTIEGSRRTAEAAPEPAGRRKVRFRDLYVERRDGPVTMAERRKAAVTTLIGIPVFGAVIVVVQAVRGRSVETSWFVAVAIAMVLVTAMSFAFPRFSPNGWAHVHSTDWSKESTASKIVAIIAMAAIIILLVARTISRMES